LETFCLRRVRRHYCTPPTSFDSRKAFSRGDKSAVPVASNGQTHTESGHLRQVRYEVWSVTAKDREEDGNHPARQVHVSVLREGCSEAEGSRHMGVQALSEADSWWRLGPEHHRSGNSAHDDSSSARDRGAVRLFGEGQRALGGVLDESRRGCV